MDVTVTASIPSSVDAVWLMIGPFDAIAKWHPAVERAELEERGTRRRLHLVGGGSILEQLESHDDAARTYSYSILEGPLPVRDYVSTLRVTRGEGGQTLVEWSSRFEPTVEPEEAERVIRGIYDAGLTNLQKMLES